MKCFLTILSFLQQENINQSYFKLNMSDKKFSLSFGFILLSIIFSLHKVSSYSKAAKEVSFMMPNVQPLQNESYLCTAFKTPKDDFEYFVQFRPNASEKRIHHIVLFGCQFPGRKQRDSPRFVWNCRYECAHSIELSCGPVCRDKHESVIYDWGLGASRFTLPRGVGVKVGKGSGINYVVLQVHYTNVNDFVDGATDATGVFVTVLPSKYKGKIKNAGMYLLGSQGTIPAGEKVNLETACVVKEPVELHPFVFQTHTHRLGKVVSAYRIDQKGNWQLIGKEDPQKPQNFYPINKSIVIKEGDILAARCTMDNFLDRDVEVGETKEDEMCNFYMMYYVDGDKLFSKKSCFSKGPPTYFWKFDKKIGYIPPNIHKEASELNGTEN